MKCIFLIFICFSVSAQVTPFNIGASAFLNGTSTAFTNAATAPTCSGAFVRTGLIGEWIFSGNALDTSGSGNNLTLTGSPTFTAGKCSTGLTLNGTSQQGQTTASTYNFTSSDFTIQIWVSVNSFSTKQHIVSTGMTLAQNAGYDLNIEPGGNINLVTYQSAASQTTTASAGPVATLFNIAVVRSGSTVTIYRNGVNQTIASGTHINPVTAANFSVGFGDGFGGGEYFGGIMNDLFVYNRALTPTEINQNISNP